MNKFQKKVDKIFRSLNRIDALILENDNSYKNRKMNKQMAKSYVSHLGKGKEMK